jgi:transcriptional regulator with XRE-family HTH domain
MNAKKLGKKIKLARVEYDLTQAQLAKKIKAKQKSISRYENGISMPSIETLVKIAKALKKSTSYFLEEEQGIRGTQGIRGIRGTQYLTI